MKPVIIAAGFALCATAHGAVVYIDTKLPFWRTESDPEWGPVHNIDINGDGVRDFFTSTYGGELSLFPVSTNRVLSYRESLPDLGWSVVGMDGGELIGSAPSFGEFLGFADNVGFLHFGQANIYKCNGRGPIGEPEDCLSVIEANNRIYYFGVEFTGNGITHYGWISMSAWFLSSQHGIDVNGWAYDTDPNQAIIAGAIPEPSTTVLIAGSAALLWTRNANARKENKALQRTPRGLFVFMRYLIREVLGFGGAPPRP